jgi:hypothetical protein
MTATTYCLKPYASVESWACSEYKKKLKYMAPMAKSSYGPYGEIYRVLQNSVSWILPIVNGPWLKLFHSYIEFPIDFSMDDKLEG